MNINVIHKRKCNLHDRSLQIENISNKFTFLLTIKKKEGNIHTFFATHHTCISDSGFGKQLSIYYFRKRNCVHILLLRYMTVIQSILWHLWQNKMSST